MGLSCYWTYLVPFLGYVEILVEIADFYVQAYLMTQSEFCNADLDQMGLLRGQA